MQQPAQLGVPIDIEKEVISGDDPLDDGAQDIGAEQSEFFAVDHGVDALLKGLKRAERAEGTSQQDEHGVAALGHGHMLDELQCEVVLGGIAGEEFLDQHHLILDAPEPDHEIVMIAGGMDLVTDFREHILRGVQPFGRAQSQQRRFVVRPDEFEFVGHGIISISTWWESAARRPSCPPESFSSAGWTRPMSNHPASF